MTTLTTTKPELRTIRAQPIAMIPITTTMSGIPDELGSAYQELGSAIREVGVEIVGPPFARYLQIGPDTVRLEAGFPVARPFSVGGRIAMSTLPKGDVAVVMHIGPYDRMETTYAALTTWVAERGREPAGAPWEVYLSDPAAEPNPETWRTEVFLPLR